MVYYNTQRPHHSLDLKSPLQYFLEKGGMSQMSLTYTYPLTKAEKKNKRKQEWHLNRICIDQKILFCDLLQNIDEKSQIRGQ
ncbi:MAG: Integrase core domain protein [Microgenomates group bacterium GW2011_GWC1_47_20]|nr:MAG: Integrase core domain protein [Microgenomates group bacterium GW2011_GWC1_47_20]